MGNKATHAICLGDFVMARTSWTCLEQFMCSETMRESSADVFLAVHRELTCLHTYYAMPFVKKPFVLASILQVSTPPTQLEKGTAQSTYRQL